jgi:hypothetical protein
MSRQNVELVQATYDAIDRDDLDSFLALSRSASMPRAARCSAPATPTRSRAAPRSTRSRSQPRRRLRPGLADQTSAVRNGSHVNPRDGERLLRDVAEE